MLKEIEPNKVKIRMVIWYFLIFSVIGLLIETLFCYITTGVIESRQGLIWGPFCPIYGVGATIFIILLTRYRKNPIKLFIAGTILGAIVEYLLSYGMEAIYGNRFWDYSYTRFHLNGRICITYSLFWGILAIVLIQWIKPLIDKIIGKIQDTTKKAIEVGVCIFLILDAIMTLWAIQTYTNKAYERYSKQIGIEVKQKEQWQIEMDKLAEKLFPEKMMMVTFPNLRIYGKDGKEIWIRDIIKDKINP